MEYKDIRKAVGIYGYRLGGDERSASGQVVYHGERLKSNSGSNPKLADNNSYNRRERDGFFLVLIVYYSTYDPYSTMRVRYSITRQT